MKIEINMQFAALSVCRVLSRFERPEGDGKPRELIQGDLSSLRSGRHNLYRGLMKYCKDERDDQRYYNFAGKAKVLPSRQ